MRYILRTCEGRDQYIPYLTENIKGLEICFDDVGGAMNNFLKSLEMAGNDPVVNIEDDIRLCNNFTDRVEAEIEKRPDSLIQFFSMRKADLVIGERWDSGGNYLMAQCTYIPAKMSAGILKFSEKYERLRHKSHPLDSMVAEYLKRAKQRYWIVVPNLVDHIIGKSAIDSRRASTNRQSFTFKGS